MNALTPSGRSRGGVVVGYDGSAPAQAAVRWAAAEALRRGTSLTVIEAVDITGVAIDPTISHVDDWPAPIVEAGGEVAEEGAALASEVAAEHAAALEVHAEVGFGSAADVLRDASHHADLVVVGSRGRGEVAAACLGSVSTSVMTHAACPVAVVRAGTPPVPGPAHPVVVGVDGSQACESALETAARIANDAHAPLRIVSVWSETTATSWMSAYAAGLTPGPVEIAAGARACAQQAAAEAAATAHRAYPALEVTTFVVEGQPAGALVAASNDAGLLVVGTRGHGALAGLVLGSVSHGVSRGARCAVAVVKPAHQHGRHEPVPAAAAHV